jgi:hypothetical protein
VICRVGNSDALSEEVSAGYHSFLVILSVAVDGTETSFTLEELLAMRQSSVVTANFYVSQVAHFQGPSLRSVLLATNVPPSATLTMVALNDYTVRVPARDAYDYKVILAVQRDGEPMSVRNKGPIWVIYPMDDHPELQGTAYNDRLVWQLRRVIVE